MDEHRQDTEPTRLTATATEFKGVLKSAGSLIATKLQEAGKSFNEYTERLERERAEREAKANSPQTYEIGTIAVNDATHDSLSNQYAQVGFMVDMWADLVEGYAEKAEEYLKNFLQSITDKNISSMTIKEDELLSTGLFTLKRKMLFFRRAPVTLTVYVGKQGSDLYLSWRAFVQAEVAAWKFVLMGVLGFLLGLIANGMIVVDLINMRVILDERTPNLGEYFLTMFIWVLGTMAVVSGVLALHGLVYRDGDYLAHFRHPLSELHVDDVLSASGAIHKAMIAAADKIGIDTAELEVREPFYKKRRKSII